MSPSAIEEDFIIPGFPAGSVGAWIAPGGTGKSYLAMELAQAVASPMADIAGFGPSKSGKVMYLNAEDGEQQLRSRMAALGTITPPETLDELEANLNIVNAMGMMMDFGVKHREFSRGTDADSLVNTCQGFRLIIIDTLNRFHRLEENDNGQMSYLLSVLESVARQTGAGVLFMHHANKYASRNQAGDNQTASRGASALTDNIRYAATLTRMTSEEAKIYGLDDNWIKSFLRFSVVKQNAGLPQGDRWFERRKGGVLRPVKLTKIISKPQGRNNREED